VGVWFPFMYILINESQIMLAHVFSCICLLFGYEVEIEIDKEDGSNLS